MRRLNIPSGSSNEKNCPDYDVVCIGQSVDGTQDVAQSVNNAACDEPRSGLLQLRQQTTAFYRRCRRQAVRDKQNFTFEMRCSDLPWSYCVIN
jgi:hypothetical protein